MHFHIQGFSSVIANLSTFFGIRIECVQDLVYDSAMCEIYEARNLQSLVDGLLSIRSKYAKLLVNSVDMTSILPSAFQGKLPNLSVVYRCMCTCKTLHSRKKWTQTLTSKASSPCKKHHMHLLVVLVDYYGLKGMTLGGSPVPLIAMLIIFWGPLCTHL